ncbi:MAG: hypothetical protein U0525_00330 [Patescibacteria group bacterium]
MKLLADNYSKGEVIFSVQQQNIYSNVTKTVDETYRQAKGAPFAINTVTNPLFVNTTWAYAYEYHGKPKYGYLPIWKGLDQTGRYGDDVKFGSKSPQKDLMLFTIFEPSGGIPKEYVAAYSYYDNLRSNKLSETEIGNYKIEKRVFTNEMGLNLDDIVSGKITIRQKDVY